MIKLRLALAKTEEARYTSHLDTMRMMIRSIRRCGLPIAYTNGFNKHPILSFLLPLSMGITSNYEPVDLAFEDGTAAQEVETALGEVLPRGFRIVEMGEIGCAVNDVYAAEYQIKLYFEEGKNGAVLSDLLASNEPLLVEKKSKKGMIKVDIRPMIYDAKWSDETNTLTAVLACGTEKNLNPSLLLQALSEADPAFSPLYFKAHRAKILTQNNAKLIQ